MAMMLIHPDYWTDSLIEHEEKFYSSNSINDLLIVDKTWLVVEVLSTGEEIDPSVYLRVAPELNSTSRLRSTLTLSVAEESTKYDKFVKNGKIVSEG